MKVPKYFIGVDVSKLTLDVSIFNSGQPVASLRVGNSEKDIKSLFASLKIDYRCRPGNSMICAENMGIYNTFLCKISRSHKFTLCLESPLQIKKSLGIQRGKNDEIDAGRIAEYASKNFNKLKPWQPPREIIVELKKLSRLRSRLIKARVMLTGNRKREIYYLNASKNKELTSLFASTLKALLSDIQALEEKMLLIILSDEKLSRLMELIISVPRININAGREIILATNEFESTWTAKRFACYCGIAPFEYASGTSVKGKSRVSIFANKNIKAILHMAAMGVIQGRKDFLHDYYHRKVAEGKNKMSVINAVRNKLVHRIFACVRDDKFFSEAETSGKKLFYVFNTLK